MIKICGEHGYREQGSDISELSCPGCQESEEENRGSEETGGEGL